MIVHDQSSQPQYFSPQRIEVRVLSMLIDDDDDVNNGGGGGKCSDRCIHDKKTDLASWESVILRSPFAACLFV